MISNPINSVSHHDTDKNPLLTNALGYAYRYQWRVFSIYGVVEGRCACAGVTKECSPGKHPITRHGFLAATTNEERVQAWWRTYPWANIGAPTGQKSGFIVLDVDPKHGGLESLAALEAQHGTLDTLTAITGSGGTHYYFLPPATPLRNSVGDIAPGIDTRAEGGYVLLPPPQPTSPAAPTAGAISDPPRPSPIGYWTYGQNKCQKASNREPRLFWVTLLTVIGAPRLPPGRAVCANGA
jgi:hypothetical protein